MPFARLSYGLLTSQDQGGGDKKQGLPPIVGLGHFSINIIRRKSWPSSSSFTKVSSDKCSLYFAKQTGSNRPGTVAMSFFYNLNAFTGNYVITNNINSFTNFTPPTNYRGFLLVNTSNCSINTTIPKSILQSSSNNNIRINIGEYLTVLNGISFFVIINYTIISGSGVFDYDSPVVFVY